MRDNERLMNRVVSNYDMMYLRANTDSRRLTFPYYILVIIYPAYNFTRGFVYRHHEGHRKIICLCHRCVYVARNNRCDKYIIAFEVAPQPLAK